MKSKQIAKAAALGLILGTLNCGAIVLNDGSPDGSPGNGYVLVEVSRRKLVDKIDLLFMIDNSASMADKQQILAKAVPDLVDRLVTPVCVENQTGNVQKEKGKEVFSVKGACSTGNSPAFAAVKDIHIGVISSSLGGHGSSICEEGGSGWNPSQNDKGRLITRGPQGTIVETWNNKGFLDWDPLQMKSSPPGLDDADLLKTRFQAIVEGTGQDGCGFEASLEAWYRFLVDPAPYLSIVPSACSSGNTGANCKCGDHVCDSSWNCGESAESCASDCSNCRARSGIDPIVLEQRKEFLRPDSLLAVLMLSDENDCSIVDGGQAYLLGKSKSGSAQFHLPRGTAACETDPNSPECRSCGTVNVADHPECQTGYSDSEDPSNLRCYRQKQRFGVDWLYPVARYVDGLTKMNFPDGSYNPIFCATDLTVKVGEGKYQCQDIPRDPNLVFLAGIVGVPWQDIAKDPTNLENGYYRSARELAIRPSSFTVPNNPAPPGLPEDRTLWDVIIGDPSHNVEPLDPLMVESVEPRSGNSPIVNAPLQPTKSPTLNPVNGTERSVESDLQYACRFQLPTVRDCTVEACDCEKEPNNPLCRDPQSGVFDATKQFYAKAYPGRRQLTVLKGLGEQAIVASICAAETSDDQSSIYGYRPAIRALIDRFKLVFRGGGYCLDQELQPDKNGAVECMLIEGRKLPEDASCSCDSASFRTDVSTETRASLEQLPNYIDNGLNCACQIPQVDAAGMKECTTNPSHELDGVNGWCYVNAAYGGSASIVVEGCSGVRDGMIRFVGKGLPSSKSKTFLMCKGL